MSRTAPEDSIPSTPPAPEDDVLSGATGEDNPPLQLPTLSNLTPLGSSPRDSFTPSAKVPLVSETEKNDEKGLEDNDLGQSDRRKPLFKRRLFWLVVVAALVIVVLAVMLPVYFTVIKPKNNKVSGGGKTPDQGSPQPTSTSSPKGLTTGGDGSTVTTDNGTQFTYRNPFGGFCTWILFSDWEGWRSHIVYFVGVWDPEHPFNDGAQPNSWTPPLNTTWKWGANQLYG